MNGALTSWTGFWISSSEHQNHTITMKLRIGSSPKRIGVSFLPLVLPMVALAQTVPAVTVSPLAGFGGGDGWLAPGEGGYTYLGTGNLERGMAFGNGNLYLVSRNGGNNVRILNGSTGADVGALDTTGVTGGTFAVNMVGVGGDGSVYVGNLTTAAGTPFKVYQWTSDTAAPSVAYSVNPGLPRIGDSLAVTGSGSSTIIAASGTGSSGFATFTGGVGTAVSVAGTAAGDYRLGLTFVDPGVLVGTQGGSWKVTQFSGNVGTLAFSLPTTSASERLMAYDLVGGFPLLATTDTVTSQVRIYDVSNPAQPTLLTSANNTSGTLAANGNGVGAMSWGTLPDGTKVLYAMSANQGIQAFAVTVPEPGTYALVAAGLGALWAIRRRR